MSAPPSTTSWQPSRLRRSRKLVFIVIGILAVALCLSRSDQLGGRPSAAHPTTAGRSEPLIAQLERQVRIICWVMTSPKFQARALAVKNTWGKRCDRLIFVTPEHDDALGETFVANVTEDSHELLWDKVLQAFRHIHREYHDQFDWVIKTDDDGYVLVENLRYFLAAYSPETPIYFGHNFKFYETSYMAGGCGYVLSREALRLFVEVALEDPSKCLSHVSTSVEDVEISACLQNVGAFPGDSRDAHNQWRFLPFPPHYALIQNYLALDNWFWHRTYYQPRIDSDSLSQYAIGFHYVSPEDMYAYDFLNYEFQLHGDEDDFEERLPAKVDASELVAPASDNDREFQW